MAKRKLKLEIKQSDEHGGCGPSRIPRWYGGHAITTNDITGSVMKILVTDPRGKQISISIGQNGSIKEVNRKNEEIEEGSEISVDNINSPNEIDINISDDNILPHSFENNQEAVLPSSMETLDKSFQDAYNLNLKTIKKEFEEFEEPQISESLNSFGKVIDVISEGYNTELLDREEVQEEFHAEMEDIKSEEPYLIGKFETVFVNSVNGSENYDISRQVERVSEFSGIISGNIDITTMSLICRLCAIQRKDMIDIFEPNDAYKYIIDKIEDCLSVLVKKSDTLPQQVCRLCLEKLELFHKFRKTVADVEKQFSELRERLSNESEDPDKYGQTFPPRDEQLDEIKPIVEQLASNENMSDLKHSKIIDPGNELNSNKKMNDKVNADAEEDIIFVGEEVNAQINGNQSDDEDLIKCRICGMLFGTARSCHLHSDIHSSENYYPCSMCDSQFTTRKDAARHSVEHTRRKVSKTKVEIYKKTISSYNLRSTLISGSNRTSNNAGKVNGKDEYIFHANDKEEGEEKEEAEEGRNSVDQSDDQDMIKCKICGRYFGTPKSCYTHSKIHATENHRPCSMCDAVFTNEGDSLRHSHEHIRYKTPQRRAAMCKKKISINVLESNPIIRNHRASNSLIKIADEDPENNANILCEKNEVEEYTNFGNQLGDNNMIACRICGVSFRNAKCCYTHSGMHAKENHYPCIICYKAFTTEDDAYKHNLEHVMGKIMDKKVSVYICQKCGKRFGTADRLRFHDIYHDPTMKPCYCEKCDKLMASEDSLYNHIVNIHDKSMEYRCKICGRQFSGQSQLDGHQSSHTDRPFECSVCKKRFFSRYKLRSHEQEKCLSSLNAKNFTCFYCGKTFVRKWTLANHIRFHTGERPYQCEYCPKTYCTTQSRNKHQVSHAGAGRYRCTICEKRYLSLRGFRMHQLSHPENDRKYNCSFCEKSFKEDSTRWRHIRAVHQTGDLPCDICGQKFWRTYALQIHKQTWHSSE